jgi:uncharacterized glyoxalase superfamily metalloenzyme YdcJ
MTHAHTTSLSPSPFVSTDEVRSRFSRAMSAMYRREVPQYGTLTDLVSDVNALTLHQHPALRDALARTEELDRLDVERHGAIRLGTARELFDMRRIFAVMGMLPVGYYDLSVAGVPVHSTAFRPIADAALARNPFRVFTSLLRLELIEDAAMREEARRILDKRQIFTQRALALTAQCETQGGLSSAEADEFVNEVSQTFQWHSEATVSASTYQRLLEAHRLIADVVCFKGPHINHLTPRTLDIDAAQLEMPLHGMTVKAVIEGPPRRNCPILLRQTSFKALEEKVFFVDGDSALEGTHTARFGEIEQRGVALTRKGRTLYDRLLLEARETGVGPAGAHGYQERLARVFTQFPDDPDTLRREGLAFFRYTLTDAARVLAHELPHGQDLGELIACGVAQADPITYEDFLPVSAAGIFQSNLGGAAQKAYSAKAAQAAFESDLGTPVFDEIALYAQTQEQSIATLMAHLRAKDTV